MPQRGDSKLARSLIKFLSLAQRKGMGKTRTLLMPVMDVWPDGDPVDRVNFFTDLVQQTNYVFACVPT